MHIEEFIQKYCCSTFRGYVEYIFEGNNELEDGIPIPEGFELLTEICRYPVFMIFVNKNERAILRFYGDEYSLSIYDSLFVFDVTIEKHMKYYKDAYITQWYTLVTVDAVENVDLFYPGGNYLGGSKGFYKTNLFENVRKEYEYSLEDIKKINPNLKVNKTPWYLIIEDDGSEGDAEIWFTQIQNPILSTGEIKRVNSFLLANRNKV